MDEVEVRLEEMDHMEEMVRHAEAERDEAIQEKEEAVAAYELAHKQVAGLSGLLKRKNKIFAEKLRKANSRYVKSIAKPSAWFASAGVFALIVNFLVRRGLVSPLLGTPAISVCICICSVFVGIIMERIDIRRKAKYHIRKDEQTWQ